MAATSENEIIEMIDKVEEKMRLRMRETADWRRGEPACNNNRAFLLQARNNLQDAISHLLQVKW